MSRSRRPIPPSGRPPVPWLPVVAPARGSTAVAAYLRAHLYGAAVGRSILDRCISAVDAVDKERLVPLRSQFEQEIAAASGLLAMLSPVGAPGRRLVRMSAAVSLAALPAGPVIRDPLARLAVLETLRTLVVAKRSMWELLEQSWVADGPAPVDGAGGGDDDDDVSPGPVRSARVLLLDLAAQARAQEQLLEELRRAYGEAVFR